MPPRGARPCARETWHFKVPEPCAPDTRGSTSNNSTPVSRRLLCAAYRDERVTHWMAIGGS